MVAIGNVLGTAIAIKGPDSDLRSGVEATLHALGARAAVGWESSSAAALVVLPDASRQAPQFAASPPILAVTDTEEAMQSWLDRGARGVLSVDSSPAVIAAAALVVAAGHSVGVPCEDRSPAPAVTHQEVGWLQSLRRGDSVAVVAACAGISERTMYRHLKRLYKRLNVENRNDAMFALARSRVTP